MTPQPHIYLSYRPILPLRSFVDRVWYWEGPAPAHARDRILPSGCAGLIINLAEDVVRDYADSDQRFTCLPGAVLVGAHSRYSVIDASDQRAVIGVDFTPGGMAPFFEPAADELHNAQVALGDLWGERGRSLRERVLHEATPTARLDLVVSELSRWATKPLQRRAEVDFLITELTSSPQRTVAELSERAGLSVRRLSRLFALQTGLTPKRFARIKRFEQMLRRMNAADRHWSEIAQHCGYFDQSHLIHECRELSGCTPEELQRLRLGDTRHIPL